MKAISALPVFLFAGMASPVLAQSVQDGFYTNGYAELGYYQNGSNNDTVGITETTLGYNTSSGFGFEIGVDAVITKDDSYSALYGALVYQSSFGKLSFGAPRAVMDAYLGNVPSLGGNTLFDVSFYGLGKRSYITSSYLFNNNVTPIGLRYDGTFGSTNVGASYHRYDDINVYDLAANMQFGSATVSGAIEHLETNTSSDTRYFLGVESKFGPVTAGLLYGQNAFLGNGGSVELYAKYKPLDQLELTATALDLGSGFDTTYGLAADYTFSQGLYVKAGVADSFTSGSNTAVNLALGLRF